MKSFLLNLTFLLTALHPFKGHSQTVDTLIDVGSYKLHFNIIKGTGLPILFESGGGDDGTVWNNIIKPLANITRATLITYDRAGFGKSSFDSTKHGILNGIIGLETALHKLGYDGKIMLVAHSLGGFYTTLYAFRHPDKVKTAVMIDANTSCFFDEKRLAILQNTFNKEKEKYRLTNPGLYYQFGDFTESVSLIKKSAFPITVPAIDFVSESTPFNDTTEINAWKHCHQEFVKSSQNRTGIIAYGCGHYIFKDNSSLIINSVVKAYSKIADKNKIAEILKRGLDYAISAANETKKNETAYNHSEDDLNSWGYKLLQQGQIENALQVFKLNILLNPKSWNAYDSYGETLLANGQKEEAIKMYKKSVELNPNNDNGKKVLEDILKQKN